MTKIKIKKIYMDPFQRVAYVKIECKDTFDWCVDGYVKGVAAIEVFFYLFYFIVFFFFLILFLICYLKFI